MPTQCGFQKGHIPWNKNKKGVMPIPWDKGMKRPDISKLLKKRKGNKNPNWKGGIKNRQGYVLIYIPNHPAQQNNYVYKHRLVMEKHLRRYLKSEERIHHINGIKDDNRLENLLLCKNNLKHRIVHSEMEKMLYNLIQKGKVYYDRKQKKYMETS